MKNTSYIIAFVIVSLGLFLYKFKNSKSVKNSETESVESTTSTQEVSPSGGAASNAVVSAPSPVAGANTGEASVPATVEVPPEAQPAQNSLHPEDEKFLVNSTKDSVAEAMQNTTKPSLTDRQQIEEWLKEENLPAKERAELNELKDSLGKIKSDLQIGKLSDDQFNKKFGEWYTRYMKYKDSKNSTAVPE